MTVCGSANFYPAKPRAGSSGAPVAPRGLLIAGIATLRVIDLLWDEMQGKLHVPHGFGI
jgi:hypothetical protein